MLQTLQAQKTVSQRAFADVRELAEEDTARGIGAELIKWLKRNKGAHIRLGIDEWAINDLGMYEYRIVLFVETVDREEAV